MSHSSLLDDLFPNRQSLKSYIATISDVPFVGLDNVQVAARPFDKTRQQVPEVTSPANMEMILIALEAHFRRHHIKQPLSRAHLEKTEWNVVLNIIGVEEMMDLLLNCCVLIELPKNTKQVIAGPVAQNDVLSYGKRQHPDDAEQVESSVSKIPRLDLDAIFEKPLNHRPTLYANHSKYTSGPLKLDIKDLFETADLKTSDFPLDRTSTYTKNLLKEIFPFEMRDRRKTPPGGMPLRLVAFIPLLEQLVKNLHATDLRYYLNWRCPAIVKKEDSSVPIYKCATFIKSVVKENFPLDLFGSEENRESFYKGIEKFMKLKKNDTVTIGDLLGDLDLNHCTWPSLLNAVENVNNPTDLKKRKEMMANFVYWAMDKCIRGVIKVCFYVTETQHGGYDLSYYRHDDWNQNSHRFMERMLMDNFEEVGEDFVKGLQLGSSFVRLLPKGVDFRMITSMNKTVKLVETSGGSSRQIKKNNNKDLEAVKLVMDFEVARQTNILESSPDTIKSAVERLGFFKDQVGAGAGAQSDTSSNFYFSKVDISHCFGTINQQKLLDSVKHLFLSGKYAIHRYNVFRKIGTGVIYHPQKMATKSLLPEAAIGEYGKFTSSSLILPSQTEPPYESKEKLWELIKEHIKENTITYRGKFYRQTQGIPQGSAISSLLCELYLDQLENEHLKKFTEQNKGILLRYVDDFVYISMDMNLVQEFDDRMKQGFEDYEMFINPTKHENNLNVEAAGVSWCGLRISTANLDIFNDITNNTWQSVKSRTTISTTTEPMKSIKDKCIRTMRRQFEWNDVAKNSTDAQYQIIAKAAELCGLTLGVYITIAIQAKRHMDSGMNELEEEVAKDVISSVADWTSKRSPHTLNRKYVKGFIYNAFVLVLTGKKPLDGVVAHADHLLKELNISSQLKQMSNSWPTLN